jgi:hypothetical protein
LPGAAWIASGPTSAPAAKPMTSVKGDAERDEVDLRGQRRAVLLAGGEQALALGGAVRGGLHDRREVEAEQRQCPDRHDQRAHDEQHRLDHLDPGGAAHAADEDVGDHHDADDGDHDALGEPARDAEQQRDQCTGTGHLREQVEERHRQGGGGRRGADRALLHPERQDVAHGETAGVAQQLRDQQQRDQPRDQEADRVEEAVVAVDRDGAGDAQERRRREVVTGDREPVLGAGETPARGVEVGGGLPRLPTVDVEDDPQRHDHERQEDGDVQRRVAVRGRRQDGRAHRVPSISPRSFDDSGSSTRPAKRM